MWTGGIVQIVDSLLFGHSSKLLSFDGDSLPIHSRLKASEV